MECPLIPRQVADQISEEFSARAWEGEIPDRGILLRQIEEAWLQMYKYMIAFKIQWPCPFLLTIGSNLNLWFYLSNKKKIQKFIKMLQAESKQFKDWMSKDNNRSERHWLVYWAGSTDTNLNFIIWKNLRFFLFAYTRGWGDRNCAIEAWPSPAL